MATPIPKNRARFTLAEIARVTDALEVWAAEPATTIAGRLVEGVSTDSRSVSVGELFVALGGERFDGHAHVLSALQQGAVAALVSREREAMGLGDLAPGQVVVRVRDTLAALGALGRAHRRRWAGEPRSDRGTSRRVVVGITGSAGKTTTRHAVSRLLSALGKNVHSSAGNLNNAVGVPMTLLGLEAAHEVAVVEIGMNSPGEIDYATRIAEPEIGIVTLVAEAHTEGVGSYWGVLREKGALLAALDEDAVAIANVDDPGAGACLLGSGTRRRLGYGAREGAGARLVSFEPIGLGEQRIAVELRRPSEQPSAFEQRSSIEERREGSEPLRVEATIPLLGEAGRYAALAALSCAVAIEPEVLTRPERLAHALTAIGGNETGRLAAIERGDGTVVLDDAYNANPASMRASLETAHDLATRRGARLGAVLGAMYELGSRSVALHEELGRLVAALGVQWLVVVDRGDGAAIARAASEAGVLVELVPDAASAQQAARARLQPGDVVLVKASNSVGLGTLARSLALT